MKILVHICCGPCAITPVRALLEAGMGVTGLYYNPNIHPLQEYLRRREGVAQMAERLGIPVIFKDDEYDPSAYFRAVVYREANRCLPCYSMRLERTLSIARRGGFEAFTSTLLYSKFQKHDLIRALGSDLAMGSGVEFHYQDFRSGWSDGIALSKEWGMYRQQYCGCLYSEFERYSPELRRQS
jgi:predicted adenine nucleotide alpha hydrolase (AANH) superfamily ATPase